MSNLVPQQTVLAIRNMINVTVDHGGIPCSLYLPKNWNQVKKLGVYGKTTDYDFEKYTCKVSVTWNPNRYRLKQLNLFVEDELPILVTLPSVATNSGGEEVNVDIVTHSVLEIPVNFVPASYFESLGTSTADRDGTTWFELVDMIVEGMHETAIKRRFKAVPRRKEEYRTINVVR